MQTNFSDIFNLPLPPLWTAVLGEHNRDVETGYERRVPIDKIITHSGYLNFQHDIGMLVNWRYLSIIFVAEIIFIFVV